MSGSPELFVVCKSCGSEVSPYVTECPYCGTRVRKRAPKLDGKPPKPSRRARVPRLSPIRPGEIPGIASGPVGRPYATIALVTLSLLGYLIYVVILDPVVDLSRPYARLAYAPFVYLNAWYELAVLLPIGLFGWLLEARHGPLVVLGLFLLFGVGGSAVAVAVGNGNLLFGAPGAAIAMIAAWAVPDIERARHNREYDGDLLGAATLAMVVVLMPLATPVASVVATGVGLIGGLLCGRLLAGSARWTERRYSAEQVDAAVAALAADPERFAHAQEIVTHAAPGLHRILGQAMSEGGWHETGRSEAQQIAALPPEDRSQAIQAHAAEEARMGMLVGAAVGLALSEALQTTTIESGEPT